MRLANLEGVAVVVVAEHDDHIDIVEVGLPGETGLVIEDAFRRGTREVVVRVAAATAMP